VLIVDEGQPVASFETSVTTPPLALALHQNYPNPFNPSTRITYAIPEAAEVQLAVYDVLGRRAAVLLQARQVAGVHTTMFDARDLPSGMYFCRLEMSPDGAQPGIPPGRDTRTVRMMLVR
jgi:hypothetical protein